MLLSTLTIVFLCILAYYFYTREDSAVFITLLVCLIGWALCTLWYAPLAISADDCSVSIHRALRIKEIPYTDIKSVEFCLPTMAERRICGSGGFMGYWGWFSDKLIGKYFAYYGKASDTFLITLKDGRKYMLGCKNPQAITKKISKNLHP